MGWTGVECCLMCDQSFRSVTGRREEGAATNARCGGSDHRLGGKETMRQAQQLIGLRNRRRIGVAMALGAILALCASLGIVGAQPPAGGPPGAGATPPPPSANVTVFAPGLQGPRGIKFG